ncbi:MAG: malate dehydrogenase [Nitrospirae bacterium]|nr:MAG: malate dehydrogenase [Nitrospirota bacterium]
MRSKVAVIGAGNVGATLALYIAKDGISDVLLYDIKEGLPQGKALDILEATPLWSRSVSVKGSNNLKDIEGSDIVVITAGAARKPGMSRDDLLHINASVIKSVSVELEKLCPDAVVIVVTNPMDVMAQYCWEVCCFPAKRVMGMGGVLDSARFRTFVALELGVSPADVEALVLGGHGDQMVPMPRFTTVRGVSITELLDEQTINALIDRTRKGGAEIVSLLQTGSAYYAPAAATYQMVRSVLLDEKRVLPAATYLDGQYGVSGYYVGVPVVLGKNGVERIIELPLTEEENRYFQTSVKAVSELVNILRSNNS